MFSQKNSSRVFPPKINNAQISIYNFKINNIKLVEQTVYEWTHVSRAHKYRG